MGGPSRIWKTATLISCMMLWHMCVSMATDHTLREMDPTITFLTSLSLTDMCRYGEELHQFLREKSSQKLTR